MSNEQIDDNVEEVDQPSEEMTAPPEVDPDLEVSLGLSEETEDKAEVEPDEGDADEAKTTETEGEIVIREDDDEDDDDDNGNVKQPVAVRQLRNQYKETRRELKEAQKALKALQEKQAQSELQQVLPEKPKMEDYYGREEEFEQKLMGWYKAKEEHESKEQESQRKQKERIDRFNLKQAEFEQKAKTSEYNGFDRLKAEVADELDKHKMAFIIEYAKDPIKLVYAVGKNKDLLDKLNKVEDSVEFIRMVDNLESRLKITRKGKDPLPEPEKTSIKSSSVSTRSKIESELEKLYTKARNGDDVWERINLLEREKIKQGWD